MTRKTETEPEKSGRRVLAGGSRKSPSIIIICVGAGVLPVEMLGVEDEAGATTLKAQRFVKGLIRWRYPYKYCNQCLPITLM